MDFVVLECTELCMDFADIVVLELVMPHMGFEDIHNLDVCHMDFVDIQLLEFAVLRMDFVRIVALDVVSLAPHIVRHIFVPDVEGKMVVVGKAVGYYRTFLFLLHNDAYHLVYGRTRKYVMKKCGRVTISNWVKIK